MAFGLKFIIDPIIGACSTRTGTSPPLPEDKNVALFFFDVTIFGQALLSLAGDGWKRKRPASAEAIVARAGM